MTQLPRCVIAAAIGISLVAAPSATAGQGTPPAWTELRSRIEPGKDVRVVLTDGRAHRGVVQSLSDTDLSLVDDRAPVRLDRDTISRVSVRGDSLMNGFVVGALAGGAGAAVLGGYVFALCANEGGRNCPSAKVNSIAYPLAIGIGFGLVIDASTRGYTVIYRQPSRVMMAPIVGPGTCGLGVVVPVPR